MASLRPARTCRDVDKPAWTRYSKRKPRKSYIKALPHNTMIHFNMGVDKDDYDVVVRLVSKKPIQIRDNSLESARMAVHKLLQKEAPNSYKFLIHKYPHQVIRENKMLTGAGADRLSSGMKRAFGKPKDRAVRITKPGEVLFTVRTYSKYLGAVKEAYRRAKCKLPGSFSVVVEPISTGG